MGALTSWMIFGISIVQLCKSSRHLARILILRSNPLRLDIYHISFPNDPRWMQALGMLLPITVKATLNRSVIFLVT